MTTCLRGRSSYLESDSGHSRRDLKTSSCASAQGTTPATQILATHPLPDPRRTLLASLVIANKFLQYHAYSNKAWAKLSDLPAQEIGRCERALGGTRGWWVWVEKDLGKTSNIDMVDIPERSEMEVEVEGEDFVYGMEDALRNCSHSWSFRGSASFSSI